MDNTFKEADAMLTTMEAWAATLARNGMLVTSELLKIAVLDFRCRLNGISEGELASMITLFRGQIEESSLSIAGEGQLPGIQ